MHSKIIAQRVIDFNKAAFDNTFDTIAALQDHSEKMVKIFLEKASLFPTEGKKVITEWIETYKRGQSDFKKSVDDSFKTVEDYFVGSANAMGLSVYGQIEKMHYSAGEDAEEIKKASSEIINRSIQTKAIVSENEIKQNIIAKKKKVVAGKNGVGLAKAARKFVKPIKK